MVDFMAQRIGTEVAERFALLREPFCRDLLRDVKETVVAAQPVLHPRDLTNLLAGIGKGFRGVWKAVEEVVQYLDDCKIRAREVEVEYVRAKAARLAGVEEVEEEREIEEGGEGERGEQLDAAFESILDLEESDNPG